MASPRSKKKKSPVEAAKGGAVARRSTATSGDWLAGLLLLAAVVVAYLPVWRAGFIWDDDVHLTANACIIGPLGLAEVWTSSAAYYFPLTLTSWWLMHALWGLNPLGYHLANVAMHGACAILLWRVLRRWRIPGAWLGAALWALHPVQVESVAWVSELINEQSGLFYLLTIWFYAKRWEGDGAVGAREFKREYILALVCPLLALLSMPSTVMLPVVLGLVGWWRGRRWSWREAAGLVPFFVLSAAMSGWTIWEQKYHSGAVGAEWKQSWPERVQIAGYDVWFYLGKLAWPHPLIFVYPRWMVDGREAVDYLPVVAWAVVLAGLWWWRKGPLRPVFFAQAYFTVSLFPVLGFFDVYFFRYSFVADHFQYLASMGPLALVGAGMARAGDFLKGKHPWLKPTVSGALLVTLGVLTWRQCGMYDDIDTLWATTIARNPACSMAYCNIGMALFKEGRIDEAAAQFERTLEIDPKVAEAYYDLGLVSAEKGQLDEAIGLNRKALQIDPGYYAAHNNLGLALLGKGQIDEAMAEYTKALQSNPGDAEAHNNLGVALARKGRFDEAMAEMREAIRLKPDYVNAQRNLAKLEAVVGQGGGAR